MQGLLDLACSGTDKAYHFVLATYSVADPHLRMIAWGHQSSEEVYHVAVSDLGPAFVLCCKDMDIVPGWASCLVQSKYRHIGCTCLAVGCHTGRYTCLPHGVSLEAHTCHPCDVCSSVAVGIFQAGVLHRVAVLREVLVQDTAAHKVHAFCHNWLRRETAVAGPSPCWTLLLLGPGYTCPASHY